MIRRTALLALILAAGFSAMRFVSKGAEPGKRVADSATGDKPLVVTIGEPTEVERALDKPATLKFDKTELKDVAAAIAKQHGINVVLDRRRLAEANIQENLPITGDLPQVSLRQALGMLLGPYDLGCTTDENALTITTAENAKLSLFTRLYDVRELAMPLGDFDQPGDEWRDLLSVVQDTIAPQTWDEAGGNGTLRCHDGILIVNQFEEVHAQITELLTALVRLHRAPRGSAEVERLGYALRPLLLTKLEQVQDVHFEGGGLRDLVVWLRLRGIPAALDVKALAEVQLTDVKLPALDARRVTLRWALETILYEMDLDFVIDHDTVLITSTEREKAAVVNFLYPVGDLIDAAAEVSGADTEAAFAELMKTIRTTIAPTTWDDMGGSGSLIAFAPSRVLICEQTFWIQPQVEKLLGELRTAYKATRGTGANGAAPKPVAVLKSYELAAEHEQARGAGEPSPAEQYAALIRTMIEPKIWTDGTASISVVPGALVVRATPVVQARVGRVLQHIGALKDAAKEKPPSEGTLSTGVPAPTAPNPPATAEKPK